MIMRNLGVGDYRTEFLLASASQFHEHVNHLGKYYVRTACPKSVQVIGDLFRDAPLVTKVGWFSYADLLSRRVGWIMISPRYY
jgi:hypothetical protein